MQDDRFLTTCSPLAYAILEELGEGGRYTVEHQRVVHACLTEGFTRSTVKRRMSQLAEELTELGVVVEGEGR